MVAKLKDLRVYAKAQTFSALVYRLFERPGFRRDQKLRDQIDRANDSITANISEGFEQGSDAGFAKYLEYSKGSLAEVVSRLGDARRKGYLSEVEYRSLVSTAESLSNGLGSLIQYLDSCGWKDRGRHTARLRNVKQRPAMGTPVTPKNKVPPGPRRSPWSQDADAPSDPASDD